VITIVATIIARL